MNPLREWFQRIPVRILIDTDPVFLQIRHLENCHARNAAALHTAFFSFGENIGGLATIPDDGFPWSPTRQPVVLECWPVTPGMKDGKFTTVMQWESFGTYDRLKSLPLCAEMAVEAPAWFDTAIRAVLSLH